MEQLKGAQYNKDRKYLYTFKLVAMATGGHNGNLNWQIVRSDERPYFRSSFDLENDHNSAYINDKN